MRTIWKFPIAITDEFTIPDEQELTLPEMAQLLKVGLDPTGSPCAWFQVHTNAPKQSHSPVARAASRSSS